MQVKNDACRTRTFRVGLNECMPLPKQPLFVDLGIFSIEAPMSIFDSLIPRNEHNAIDSSIKAVKHLASRDVSWFF